MHDRHVARFLLYIEAFLRIVDESFPQSRDSKYIFAPAHVTGNLNDTLCKNRTARHYGDREPSDQATRLVMQVVTRA